MSVRERVVLMGVLMRGYRCGWLELRWLWSGDCWWWQWQWLWLSDNSPSSRGGSRCPHAATRATTASGCGTIRMGAMEFLQQHGIKDIVPGHPGLLFRSVALPVNKIFQPAAPSTASPWCCGPGILTAGPESLEEEARPARADLEWKKSMVWAGKRGTWGEFGTWGVVGTGMWPRWSASGSWTDQYSGDSASCRAGRVADLGRITTPGLQGGRWRLEHAGHPQSPFVSALPAGGGCELSPTLSRLEPVVYSWNLWWLSRPREERGLVAEYALKRGKACDVLTEGILCIFCPREETAPAELIFPAVCPEVPSEFLDLPLSLAISLWMITGGQAHCDS